MDYKLGKLPVKYDSRNIKLRNIFRIKLLPPLPNDFDVDSSIGGLVDDRMFANDQWGDCVIAGRAHHTMRFEKYEQGVLINILDSEVLDEYWKEQGDGSHPDNGLVMLDSLNRWRHDGWIAATKHYDIYAYAEVGCKELNEVKYSIYLLYGAYAGLFLPLSAQSQIQNGQIWSVTSGPESLPGTWGGHCVYLVSYDDTGPTCMTWGKRQQMTWEFWMKYAEECYCIVDNKDAWVDPSTSPLDIQKLDGYLHEISGTTDTPPQLSPICTKVRKFFKALNKNLRG